MSASFVSSALAWMKAVYLGASADWCQ